MRTFAGRISAPPARNRSRCARLEGPACAARQVCCDVGDGHGEEGRVSTIPPVPAPPVLPRLSAVRFTGGRPCSISATAERTLRILSASAGCLANFQHLCRLGAGQLLEVPHRQHFAVCRIHLSQRLVQPCRDIGLPRGRRRPSCAGGQLRHQRDASPVVAAGAVQSALPGNFALWITHLRTQVMSVQLQQSVADHPAQPQE